MDSKKFLSFCIVGGTGALIELILFNIFLFFNLGFVLAKFISLFLAITFVFFTNRKITFFATSGKMRVQAMKYVIVYSFAFVVNFSVSLFFVNILPQSTFYSNVSAAGGIIFAIPVSFLGSLFWVFKK